ncbi:MAG: inositol-3-phosphate synthase [Proteobacteria bacterium]|nr:inositol-3-phosphate synthase [Pseudomonadota bacterium]
MTSIRVAIAGVGNCASALVQGVAFYGGSSQAPDDGSLPAGLMHARIGEWGVNDITFSAAFDVDARKVGRPLEEAVFAPPNCTPVFQASLPGSGVVVEMGPVLDGVATHMADHAEARAFRVAACPSVDVAQRLRETKTDVLVCYLPVGAEQAVRAYAEACLEARVAMVNCMPVFIASDPSWAARFEAAGVPIVGDDIKSQIGATMLHRALARMFTERGVKPLRTYQLNTGGNTDFLNMLDRGRLQSKKRSKTAAVQSQLDVPLAPDQVHIGPSDYVAWQGDNKVAFIRLEGLGFGNQPIEIEVRLSVIDSPNSAGVVIDALRCAALARQRGIGGALLGPSAWYMKHPPRQMRDAEAQEATEAFITSQ